MDTLGSIIAGLIVYPFLLVAGFVAFCLLLLAVVVLLAGVGGALCSIAKAMGVPVRSDRPRARIEERKPRYRRGPRGEPDPDPPPEPEAPPDPATAALAIEEREDEAEATVFAIASRSADGRPLEPHAPPAAPVGHVPAAGAS